jgi:hypothetical protein
VAGGITPSREGIAEAYQASERVLGQGGRLVNVCSESVLDMQEMC